MTAPACLLLLAFLQATQSRPASLPSVPRPRPFAEVTDVPAPRPGTVRVYVVRHGESVGNATQDDPRLSDAEKDRLSERGQGQAKAVGELLARLGVRRLCHSPAVRARETAEAAARAFPAAPPLEAAPTFAPLIYGQSPTASRPATAALTAAWARGEDLKLPGGESLADMTARAARGVPGLHAVATKAGGPVALVAHGETVIAWLMGLQGPLVVHGFARVRVPNGAVAAFDVAADGTATCVGWFVP